MNGALTICVVMAIAAVISIFVPFFTAMRYPANLVLIAMAGIFGGLAGYHWDKYKKWKSKL